MNFTTHEHHVSIINAYVNTETDFLELSIELTAHDLEYYFEKKEKTLLKLGSEKEKEDTDQLISKYINQHLIFTLKEKTIQLKFIGKEVKNDETLWLYFQGKINPKTSSITVKNNILIEVFENSENYGR